MQQLDSLFESRRTNEDKLTTKHLGLPRPNVSIQQVSTKGGRDPTCKNCNERKSWLAGCEVAITVCVSIRLLNDANTLSGSDMTLNMTVNVSNA